MSYFVGGRAPKRYSPSASVMAACLMPLSTSVAVTVALDTTAPEGSLTVPLMSPEAPTPCAWTMPVNSRHARIILNRLLDLINPPKWLNVRKQPGHALHLR